MATNKLIQRKVERYFPVLEKMSEDELASLAGEIVLSPKLYDADYLLDSKDLQIAGERLARPTARAFTVTILGKRRRRQRRWMSVVGANRYAKPCARTRTI